MKANKYNLIDESWIPIAGRGKVGLGEIFADDTVSALGGNPVEKISAFKLLLAIAQSAYTPADEDDWQKLGRKGLQQKVKDYLADHHDCFWLYGEKPFLQMPAIEKAAVTSYGSLQLQIATGNTTVVTQIQIEKPLSDAGKALLLITLMGFAPGGKKADNSIVLTPGYAQKCNEKGKPSTAKSGPSLGYSGFAHSFFTLDSVIDSVYINLFSHKIIADLKIFPKGLGNAPWMKMPQGEDDSTARDLKGSYLGRLIPLNRFILFSEAGVHYSEGIQYPGYESGVVDPSITIDFSAKPKPKVILVDPERKPWRQLISMLSFMDFTAGDKFICFQLSQVLPRLSGYEKFAIWSGGVSVSSNAGEQYVAGSDDFVESEVQFSSAIFSDSKGFYETLHIQMDNLNALSKRLYGCVMRYYNNLKSDSKNIAANSTNIFWQLCESQFQQLVNACMMDSSGNKARQMEPVFISYILQIYDQSCPKETARQLEAWAENRPFGGIIKEVKDE